MTKEETSNNTDESTRKKPLLLWPGIVLLMLQLLIRFIIPIVEPELAAYGILGGMFFGIAIIIWWVFFSRAYVIEKWGALLIIIAVLFLTSLCIHESIATGAQGMMFLIIAIPVVSFTFVAWAVLTRNLSNKIRRFSMVATLLLSCGVLVLLRVDGITGDFDLNYTWRWSETAESQLLKLDSNNTMEIKSILSELDSIALWPGFRGPNRDSKIHGIRIETDWSLHPPEELWRRPIGPGCSSFAVNGDYFYTQEQRGEFESVSCYNIVDGKLIWIHGDSARFWDTHAGAGPHSTPTLSGDRVYTLGATGILNALNEVDGTVVWSRNAASDTDLNHSGWGYSSSPLIIGDVVVVSIVGKMVAYDIDTGEPRWSGPDGEDSYSSPHLLTIDSIPQVLLLSGTGATSISTADGTLLWQYSWPGSSRIVQPAVTDDGDLLISEGDGVGLRRISISHEDEDWFFKEKWTSAKLKPNFNDFIIHRGFAYGYTGPFLCCIDINDGDRKWKGKRYGGQIILLEDQNLIVVLSEKGELAIVNATPDEFTELASLKAIDGKTWNHPVLAEDILLVRNTQEMVAYRLPLAGK